MINRWRELIGSVPRAGAQIALATLLGLLAGGAGVALMATSAWLLSRAAEHPPVLYLMVAVVLVRTFGIGKGVLRYAERLSGHDLALRLQSALRLDTYRRLAGTTLLGRRRGDLLSRVVADVDAVQDLVVRVFLPFASATAITLGCVLAIGWLSPAAGLWLLVTSLISASVVPWLTRWASRAADAELAPLRGDLADVVGEAGGAALDLAAHGASDTWLQKLVAVDERLRRAEQRAALASGFGTAGQLVATGAAVLGSLAIGAPQVVAGDLSRVHLAVLVLTPLALHEVLSVLPAAAQHWTRTRSALDRVHAVRSAPSVGTGDRHDSASTAGAEAGVRTRALAAGWPDGPPVLTGLDLDVRPGERVAVTGPSGAGKTTLAATLLGLIPPLAGTVEHRGRIGYLAQDAHIFDTTVAENVRVGNGNADEPAIRSALAHARLDLDPDRKVGAHGRSLSGGEDRRLALSRLLVGEVDLLVLDEPTEHLDAATADRLIDDIWTSCAALPILVLTHDPRLVARCERTVALDQLPSGTARRVGRSRSAFHAQVSSKSQPSVVS
ncbi:MAG: thiol reductant ABC exporter subunit CydC [Propionibacteriaceae bacterium]